MKKLLCILFSVVMAVMLLVSCEDDNLGSEFLDKYPVNNTEIEDVSLNLYIITDDNTADNAKTTVKSAIAQHTLVDYHSEVSVHFISESEYDSKVLDAVNSTKDDAANIVLVNSPELMQKLVATGKLADLSEYLNTDKFGTLNVSVEKLLDASYVQVGEESKLLSIPNNHKIGEYEFLVIDEEIAKQTLKYNASVLDSYKTYADTAELRDKIATELKLDPDKYVQVVKGNYSLKAQLEAENKVCNIITYPIVDEDEAFSSAFAIVDKGEVLNERSMEIVYALTSNYDTKLRNYLQYGVIGTNYTLSEDGKVLRVNDSDNCYYMNLLYTGDVFYALYCDELNWNAEASTDAARQNEEAVVITNEAAK